MTMPRYKLMLANCQRQVTLLHTPAQIDALEEASSHAIARKAEIVS